MLRFPLIVIFILNSSLVFSQLSDFIVVKKKNGRTIGTFMAGKAIVFKTNTGDYIDGQIEAIRDDSIFVITYKIRTVPTNLGVTIVDTVSRSVFATNYRNISRVKINDRSDREKGLVGSLLMVGGSGYILLNSINSAGHGEPFTEKQNLRNLGIAAGAVALGYLVTNHFFIDNFNSKWHKFVYVNMH